MQIPCKLAANIWKLWRVKFLTIALSLKDIELGLNSPTESFPCIKLHSVAGMADAMLV